jgi:hypothetical protein
MMISTFEFKSDTIKVLGEKMRRTDQVEGAIDRVLWKQAVKRLTQEVDEPVVHIQQGVGRLDK